MACERDDDTFMLVLAVVLDNAPVFRQCIVCNIQHIHKTETFLHSYHIVLGFRVFFTSKSVLHVTI